MSNGPMEVISPFVLRAIACDIEEMQSPQAWADRCRAAAAEIEKLRAALKQTRRDALEKAARWHDDKAQIWQNTYAKETLSGLDMQAARIQCLERYGFHIIAAADIRALGEKE